MTEETKQKVFEPFFTTKDKGKGTGMGLATVYGIVKQNKAIVFVYSEPGKGTMFKIYWPTTEEKISTNIIENLTDKDLSGNEIILFVEDNEEIRNYAAASLKEFGYQVHVAENGAKALDLLINKKQKINLLVTDLVMPEINGKELSEKTKEALPDTKILFVSGYTDNHIVHSGELERDVNFLEKPYTVRNLLQKIRKILDG